MVAGRRFVFSSLLLERPPLVGLFLVRAQIELARVVFLNAAPLASAGVDSALRDSTFQDGRQALVMFYP